MESLQVMLASFKTAFLEELPEKFDKIEWYLLDIEKNGIKNDNFNELYRIVHSLKGGGGTHGLHIITTICHQLEDLLNTFQAGPFITPEMISVGLKFNDLLKGVLPRLFAGETEFVSIEKELQVLSKAHDKRSYSILLVGESNLAAQIYTQAMASLSLKLVRVPDGLQALARGISEYFDIVITTNEIPVLNGFALIGALKLSSTRNPSLKAVLVTSNKNLLGRLHRYTDPDYIIEKDKNVNAHLLDVVSKIIGNSKSP